MPKIPHAGKRIDCPTKLSVQTPYTSPPFIKEPQEAYHARRNQFLTAHGLIEFRVVAIL
jgi:hypothetical protein